MKKHFFVVQTMFKRFPSVPKKCPYKKTMLCPTAVPVALWSAVRQRHPKRRH